VSQEEIEKLVHQLFQMHDLNGDGMLDEGELISLNEVIAILHQGPEADTTDVRQKYRAVFRGKLDPNGRPVPFEVFRKYVYEVLEGLDRDPQAQEMILEQFVEEARSGRRALPEIVAEQAAMASDEKLAAWPPPDLAGRSSKPRAVSDVSRATCVREEDTAEVARGPLIFGPGQAVWESSSCFPTGCDGGPMLWMPRPGQVPREQYGYPQPHPMWMVCAGMPNPATHSAPARSLMPSSVIACNSP